MVTIQNITGNKIKIKMYLIDIVQDLLIHTKIVTNNLHLNIK